MWIAETRQALAARRLAEPGRLALVPTMGALHEGHLALVRAARARADRVVVSIFVNPTQFGPNEDYERYPRDFGADRRRCAEAGADGIFAPAVETIYPPAEPACRLDVPALTGLLEGACRPGHFQGVLRVVAKLFHLVRPDLACFGRKDYQQLKVIEALAGDLAMSIEILACPTVRDEDGLALSSRNAYLTPAARERARGIPRALEAAARRAGEGERRPEALEAAMAEVLTGHGLAIEYAVVRHPQTLAPLECIETPPGAVALVAARVDAVRLIDNRLLPEEATGTPARL